MPHPCLVTGAGDHHDDMNIDDSYDIDDNDDTDYDDTDP